MELLQKETAWFLSEEGVRQYEALTALEERVLFLYSYLRTVSSEDMDREHTLMKMAFLLADGVSRSGAPYAAYPDLIRPEKNPFVAYVKNAKYVPECDKLFVIMMAILQDKVNPNNLSLWIYDRGVLDQEKFPRWLADQGMHYLPTSVIDMVDPAAYEVDPSLEEIRTVLIWLFAKGGNA